MLSLLLLANAVVASQGSALELTYPEEPDLDSIAVVWSGRSVPFTHSGDHWFAVVGVDLDSRPGAHAVPVTFHYRDGRMRTESQPVTVRAQKFPTTELTVADRYVELSPEDQARVEREGNETNEIYATFTPERYWSAPFGPPIPGATDGRNFGHRRVFNGQPRAPHSGADLRARTGTPVYASNRGRVLLAKDLFYSGNTVFIDHGLGLFSTYLHLSKIEVRPGEIVARGQRIGLSGATGRVTGPHLHWGVRILDARVDPFSLLRITAAP